MDTDSPNPSPENQPPVKHQRRKRYSGKHPRRFEQKYKELNPDKYPDTIQKVMASGKTPAGMHRSICVAEILECLQPAPGMTAVDATLGYGGHTSEILPKLLPGGRLIGLDVDPVELPRTTARLRERGFGEGVLQIVQSNFAGLPRVLAAQGLSGVDLILADLGCSSMQFDDPTRGFSFKTDGPLDLRMNPNKGQSAAAWLQSVSEADFIAALTENADEPNASAIFAELAQRRQNASPQTTTEFANIIRHALNKVVRSLDNDGISLTIRRVFQAVRIEVNDEFSALETLLRVLPTCLNPGGRVAILTFHSGEDRRVKKSFQAGLQAGQYVEISEDIIRPSSEEVRLNPRASSAKLRWARKVA